MSSHFFARTEIERLLNNVVGKTLGEADINGVFDRAIRHPKITGIAGDVIEQSVLGFGANSSRDPDLDIEGILTELKTTGIRLHNEKTFEAKEPMSITGVSIGEIQQEDTFEESHFWIKCEHLLIVFYHYKSKFTVSAIEYKNFPIKGYTFNEISTEDRETLENDWTMIRDFLRYLDTHPNPSQEYPRLSSELRDKLAILDTAPKYPHRPRFRFKRDYVTSIVQSYFNKKESILDKSYSSFQELDSKCSELRHRYLGKSIASIADALSIDPPKTKSATEYIIVRMMGGSDLKLNNIGLFQKFSIIAKSIIQNVRGGHTEDMKLFSIDFEEIMNISIPFEESSFFDCLYSRHFLFPIFVEPYKGCKLEEVLFQGFKRMMLPEEFIFDKAKALYSKIRQLIIDDELRDVISYKDGVPIVNKTGVIKSAPNFPKSKGNILFVRGSGDDSSYKTVCINGINMYTQWVWLKGKYITEELEHFSYI